VYVTVHLKFIVKKRKKNLEIKVKAMCNMKKHHIIITGLQENEVEKEVEEEVLAENFQKLMKNVKLFELLKKLYDSYLGQTQNNDNYSHYIKH
jgi:hypothetical protein